MSEVKIIQKLEQHDAQFVKIDEHFEAVDKSLDGITDKLSEHDTQFVKIDEHFKVVDNRLYKITDTLLDHADKFEVLSREIKDSKEEVLQGQDKIITILKRLDEELVFTAQGIRRLDDEVLEHKVIIREHDVILEKVKTELNIV